MTPIRWKARIGCQFLLVVSIHLFGSCSNAAEPRFGAEFSVAACDEGATVRDLAFKDAVTAAYTGNPQVLTARQDIEKANVAVIGAWTGFLPSASFSMVGEHFVSYAPGSVPVSVNNTLVGGQSSIYTSYPSIGVNWNLYAGGKDVATYRGAKAGTRAAEGDLTDKTVTILSAVLSAYGDLLKAQASARQQMQAVKLLRQIAERSRGRYRQGRDSLVVVEQARSTLAQGERSYFDACKALSEKSSAMAQAVGLRLGPVHLLRAATETLPPAPEVSATVASFDALIDQDPSVRAARERVDMAQSKLQQTQAAFKPTLALFGRYDGLGQNAANIDAAYNGTHRNSYRVGVVLQQSLGPFTSEYAAMESARADYLKADASYQAAQVDAGAKLRSAWNGKRQTAQALESARDSALHAEQTQTLTRQLFGAGRVAEDAIDQSTISVLKEFEAVREREVDHSVQGWLLYRAVKPLEFENLLLSLFVSGGRIDDRSPK